MKKLALTCSLFLALGAFTAPDADAQVCLKFTQFCDGIQINETVGGNIDADWYHFDCVNTQPMSSGQRGVGKDAIANPCSGGDGNALISCASCPGLPGDFYFIIDGINDGTFDAALGLYPNGSCFFDEVGFTLQLGACTGLNLKGENQNLRAITQ
jgi:hypothetical protein